MGSAAESIFIFIDPSLTIDKATKSRSPDGLANIHSFTIGFHILKAGPKAGFCIPHPKLFMGFSSNVLSRFSLLAFLFFFRINNFLGDVVQF
jgi:hypothetical protein